MNQKWFALSTSQANHASPLPCPLLSALGRHEEPPGACGRLGIRVRTAFRRDAAIDGVVFRASFLQKTPD